MDKNAWKRPLLLALGAYLVLGTVLLITSLRVDDDGSGVASRAWQILFIAALVTMLTALVIDSRGNLDGEPRPRRMTSARTVGLVSAGAGIVALIGLMLTM